MTYRPFNVIIQQAQAASSSLTANMINNTGALVPALTPISASTDGKIALINVSDETTVISIAGVTTADIADASTGPVALAGKILNITTSFIHGDYLYVSKTGGLTNIIPVSGSNGFVDGDTIIRVGVIVRNDITPANKDLLVKMQLVGKV